MNEDQYTTAINSIATELHRLGHTQCQQPDEEQLFDLGFLFVSIPNLCPRNITALAHLVCELQKVAHTDDPDHDAERRPS
jgi:hypothetical protein